MRIVVSSEDVTASRFAISPLWELTGALRVLTGDWRQRLHVAKEVKGVVVTSIADDSPLAELGLQRGDVIEQVNQKTMTTPGEVVGALNDAKNAKGQNVLILLNRNGVNQYVALSLGNQGNG